MKCKNYHYIIDTTFYFFLCAMPFFVLFGVALFGGFDQISSVLSSLTGVFAGTEIYNAISSVIGADGVAPLFNARLAIGIDLICYIVYVTAIHLIIDCVQFIPALAHRFLDHIGGKEFE